MIGIHSNINKVPIPNAQMINRPSEQEEPSEENNNQNIENINGQDYITEVLNISKIKEGFYIGDKIAAISIEVVVQFKLTHMINASGNQVVNQWETIGMKYLTLNWEENPGQTLFDPKDEIAEKILFFIDDSFKNGEGILAHSFKGQNRVCIVVLIYLMKKYKWSLKKSMEYLKSKKQDVDIPSYFLSQLIKFESRLFQKGELTKDIPWSFDNLKDPEEKLLRNTYLNGLNKNKINRRKLNENKGKIRHIKWIDDLSETNQQIPIAVINLDKDLFFKKNIRPIFVHKELKPLKPCIKTPEKKFMMKYFSNKNTKKDKDDKKTNLSLNNILKANLINNNSSIIISGSKIYNKTQSDENNNKLINSIPIKNSNINKQSNNYNQNNNLGEIHTNLENNIDILKVPKRKGLNIDKNYLRSCNSEENIVPNNNMKVSIKSSIKPNNNENIQLNSQQKQNNFYVNSYNLSTSTTSNKNYSESNQQNIRFNNNIDNQIQISKFTENEINNINIYDEKGNNINNQLNITKRRKDHSYKRRDDKKENIIIIANKCDNIIKNNINNYYINQIGTINNNINNNNFNNSYTNKENKNNSNKIIPIDNMKKKINKRKNQLDEIDISEIKDFRNKTFNNGNNNNKIKNNVKNILGNNHRQILGINNNNTENNIFIIGQNSGINKDLQSSLSPKNIKENKKIINLTNNNNGKKFKIIGNTNLKNYNSNDNMLNNKKRNLNNNNTNINNILENNQKLNRHNHNFNIIITTKKGMKKNQTSPNNFISQISPKNINLTTSSNNNLNKYEDEIISNYNPIKKNNRNNRSFIIPKNKNYFNNDIDNNYNYSTNLNNYNISSNNKPLNNFNPNLIKRKGTPTAGHQSIKINNINNNPIKLKNNFLSNGNYKKPSTPDMIINKSNTMVKNNNNNYNNNLFNSNSSTNLNKSAHYNNKLKKLKNYGSLNNNNNNINNILRPSTAPNKGDKEKTSKDKKRKEIINHIHESNKEINNFNKNIFKMNLRPSSVGSGKNNNNLNNVNTNNKKRNDYESSKIENNNNSNINIINIGNKIELDFGNKYKTHLGKIRLGSPPVLNNHRINLGNNNIKYNLSKQRLPSPMIKSMNSNDKTFVNNINRSNTNYNSFNKNNSFNLK